MPYDNKITYIISRTITLVYEWIRYIKNIKFGLGIQLKPSLKITSLRYVTSGNRNIVITKKAVKNKEVIIFRLSGFIYKYINILINWVNMIIKP
tara:strand:+ start:379 stop:660 length:282 start_codon:yes stop_codon:yes gene_type:complete